MKDLLALAFFALLGANASAQTYQQTCQYVGSMRLCNTTTSPDLVGTMAAAAQVDQAEAQAELARDHTAAIRQQRALETEAQLHVSDPYRYCMKRSPVAKTADEAVAISSRCEREVASSKTPQQLTPTTAEAASTDKLKADAATLEAIMRSAPPDSDAYRQAIQALQATNEELARRGALK